MDFFREQDIARRNSRLLTQLFVVAVAVLIVITNLILTGFVLLNAEDGFDAGSMNWEVFLTVGGVVTLVIAGVVLINWLQFRRGGKRVAEALGGRPAHQINGDPLERRALNIVQEMALAANMPAPPLYILDKESGLNAFAAGTSPANAVVAVTRGSLEQLTRDELQGVIGHEFSHVLNGDMRLSIRLAAMLRGITFIGDVGAMLMRSSGRRSGRASRSKDDGRAAVMMIGLGLYLVGLLGGLMAGLIKSAISKQKEYLADASSVQFTRNPDGIGDALKVIGGHSSGTFVHAARAEELSHLFFGQVRHRLWSGFATHPPIEKRIQRIDPDWDGLFLSRVVHPDARDAEREASAGDPLVTAALAAAAATKAIPSTSHPQTETGDTQFRDTSGAMAEDLQVETQDPLGAMALLLSLLRQPAHDSAQRQALDNAGIAGLGTLVSKWSAALSVDDPELRLRLIEWCIPTLRLLSARQYQTFKTLLMTWISADGETHLDEWCLYQLVSHYLDPEFLEIAQAKPRFKTLQAVAPSLSVALGTVALLSEEHTEKAFQRGASELGLALALPSDSELGVTSLGPAINLLASCYPLLKVPILKSLALVAADDGNISARELTLIKAIAAVLDCPVPDALLSHHGIVANPAR